MGGSESGDMIERQREEDGVEDVKSKRRRRPPPVYFRGCRPISQLFMKWRDGFFFMVAVGPQRLRVSQLFLSPLGQRAASQTAVNHIYLSSVLHLPSQHLLFNSFTLPSPMGLSPPLLRCSHRWIVDKEGDHRASKGHRRPKQEVK